MSRFFSASVLGGIVLLTMIGANPTLADIPSARDMLKLKPVIAGVDYDRPTGADQIDACTVERVSSPASGFLLRDGNNRILRRFVDKDRDGFTDGWSYFKDGFEVYREDSTSTKRTLDQVRWLNSGGTRIGEVQGDRIVRWSQISAMEATEVFVQALVQRDLVLLESVMATAQELEAMGLPEPEVTRIDAQRDNRKSDVQELLNSLRGWSDQTVWLRFDAAKPSLIPASASADLEQDLTLFENGVIYVGSNDPDVESTAAMTQLQVLELIQVGSTWKLVDLPRPLNPGANTVLAAPEGGIRFSLYRQNGPSLLDPAIQSRLSELARYDEQGMERRTSNDPEEVGQYFQGRIKPLMAVVEAAPQRDRINYVRQVADAVLRANEAGVYQDQDAAKVLEQLESRYPEIASYIDYRAIQSEYFRAIDSDDANMTEIQENFLNQLDSFIEEYPRSDEAPEALLQLASFQEFSSNDEEAIAAYQRLARQFPETPFGRKAEGALRRFELVDQTLRLQGPTLSGGTVDLVKDYRGQTVLILFWTTWSGPFLQDLPNLLDLKEQYQDQGFRIVGINLDDQQSQLKQFLEQSQMDFPQIYQPGGMDSPLAQRYGIIMLPTMILVSTEGKVLSRDLRTAQELEVILKDVLD